MNKSLFISIACAAILFSCGTPEEQIGWAPAGDHIKTVWAEKVDPANVHQEYPRPQMVRDSYLNLNGLWEYAIAEKAEESMPDSDGHILVPFCIESSLSGVAGSLDSEHALWYRRSFTLPSKWNRKDVILHFGAVDWESEVWVNGNKVGNHKGGYDSFEFHVSPYLKKGKNEIVLKVTDATEVGELQPRGKQVFSPDRGSISPFPEYGRRFGLRRWTRQGISPTIRWSARLRTAPSVSSLKSAEKAKPRLNCWKAARCSAALPPRMARPSSK